MTQLSLHPDVEQNFGSLDQSKLVGQGQLTGIGLLRHGTDGGRATVAMVVTLDDGRQVFAETTWRLLKAAVRALSSSPIAAEEVDEP